MYIYSVFGYPFGYQLFTTIFHHKVASFYIQFIPPWCTIIQFILFIIQFILLMCSKRVYNSYSNCALKARSS